MKKLLYYLIPVVIYFYITYHVLPLDAYHSALNSLIGFLSPIILLTILGAILDMLGKRGIIQSPPPKVSASTSAVVDSVLSESSCAVSEGAAPPEAPEPPPESSSPRQPTLEEILHSVDLLDGPAFEKWCASLLARDGFTDIQLTRASGDQGVDIVAVKSDIRYAFQCKCYSSDLGNHPVQEVHAGKSLYYCHVGVVMTNRYFTSGAKELAKATGTLLWDRDKIKAILRSCYGEEYVSPTVGPSIFESDPSSYWD